MLELCWSHVNKVHLKKYFLMTFIEYWICNMFHKRHVIFQCHDWWSSCFAIWLLFKSFITHYLSCSDTHGLLENCIPLVFVVEVCWWALPSLFCSSHLTGVCLVKKKCFAHHIDYDSWQVCITVIKKFSYSPLMKFNWICNMLLCWSCAGAMLTI